MTICLVGFACTTLWYTSKTFEHNSYINNYRLLLEEEKVAKDEEVRLEKIRREDEAIRREVELLAERIRREDEIEAFRREYEAKVYAFALMRDWHSAEMIEHGTIARNFMRDHPSDITKLIDDPANIEIRQSVMILLNYFERLSLAYQTNMADNSLMKEYFRYLFSLYYTGFEEYIHRTRKEKENHKLFICYENVVKEWRAK